jgi:hypothetical protein
MATKSELAAAKKFVDLTVDEVSVVDSPANQRQFIVVKRDKTMANAKKTEVVKAEEVEEAVEEIAEETTEEVSVEKPEAKPVETEVSKSSLSMNGAVKLALGLFIDAAEAAPEGEQKQAALMITKYLEETEFYTRIDAYTTLKSELSEIKALVQKAATEKPEAPEAVEAVEVEKADDEAEETEESNSVDPEAVSAKVPAEVSTPEPAAATATLETIAKMAAQGVADQLLPRIEAIEKRANETVPAPNSQTTEVVKDVKKAADDVDTLFKGIL